MDGHFSYLHTMLRRTEVTAGEYTLVFIGYGDEKQHTVLELTYNWGKTDYEIGTAFGHLALGVPDIYATIEHLRSAGAKIAREPGPVKFGTTVIAFIEDPDGYKIELIERKAA
jgi:lactoylglutathione lyase